MNSSYAASFELSFGVGEGFGISGIGFMFEVMGFLLGFCFALFRNAVGMNLVESCERLRSWGLASIVVVLGSDGLAWEAP